MSEKFKTLLFAIGDTSTATHAIRHVDLALCLDKLLNRNTHIAFFSAFAAGDASFTIRADFVKTGFVQNAEGLAVRAQPAAPVARNKKKRREINNTDNSEK